MPMAMTKLRSRVSAYLRDNVHYAFSGFNFPATFLDLLLSRRPACAFRRSTAKVLSAISMRPIGLGRKNSLFSGSEGGAESWAILASVLNTAKLNGLDPQTYLCDVLERIVSGRTKNHQLHELLAWNWKAAREAAGQIAA
jgi:hypothetical protein